MLPWNLPSAFCGFHPGAVGKDVEVSAIVEHDRDVAIVVGRDRRYHGMVSAESLARAARSGEADPYHRAFLSEIEPIDADQTLSDVLGRVAQSPWPVPVVDAQRRYVGSISKSALLMTLDRAA